MKIKATKNGYRVTFTETEMGTAARSIKAYYEKLVSAYSIGPDDDSTLHHLREKFSLYEHLQ